MYIFFAMISPVHEEVSFPKETFYLLFQRVKVVCKCIEKKNKQRLIYLYKYKCKKINVIK